MSGICGWTGGTVELADMRAAIERMGQPLQRSGRMPLRVAAGRRAAIGIAGGSPAQIYRTGETIAGLWGHAWFTRPELDRLAQRVGVAQTFADAYEREGPAVLESLSGEFAVAVIDESRGRALLAIDRMGIRPLTYCLRDGALLFGSSADALVLHPQARPKIDPQALFNYVYFHMVPAPGTIYADVRRLLPGEYLVLDDGHVETNRYWEMRFEEHRRQPFPELKRGFVGALRESVRRAAAGGVAGAFLSGGTDSSTVAGLLGEVTGKPARTYSIGFEAQGYDEMEYARIAARHFGTKHHEYYVTPDDVVAAIPLIAAVHDQPFGNSSAVPAYYCAKLAREDGIETLLGGDGGDELFGGNARYAKQHLYSLYGNLPAALRKGLIEPVAFALPERIGLVGKAQRYMRNASQPMPARYDNYNLLERLGAANVFTAEFLDAVDAQQPQALLAQAYQQAHAETLINRMLALDLKYTLADNDLPKVTRSCELARVNVRFPILDDAVVAFSASLAPELKLKGTRLRYFFKQALRGFLPDEIIAKSKHGFGLPFGLWLQTHQPLQQIALDSLTDLKKRRLVRPEFIDELTSMRLKSHAAYYGTMVWVLMMLEQWFVQHDDSTLTKVETRRSAL